MINSKRKSFTKKVFIGIGALGTAVAAVLINLRNSDDDDYDFDEDYTGDEGMIEDTDSEKQHPLLPIKAFLWIYDHLSEAAAQEILDKVQSGEMSVDQVETCIIGQTLARKIGKILKKVASFWMVKNSR